MKPLDIQQKLELWAKGKVVTTEAAPQRRPPSKPASPTPATPPAAPPPAPLPSFGDIPVREVTPPAWLSGLLTSPTEHVPEDRFFSVGVDAGTSGIRVALYDEFHAGSTLFDFGENQTGGTRFSFPAAVGCRGERLVFGNDVVALPVANRFLSFKGALVHPEVERRLCERWAALRQPYAAHLRASARPTAADFLFTVSLARALEIALPALVGTSDQPGYATFTLGAPINENRNRAARFEQAIAAALWLVGSIGNQPRIEILVEQYAHARNRSAPILHTPANDRRIGSRSEAHSAILPLRRIFEPLRNFLVADIGATTTDIVVVRIGSEQRPYCYAAHSAPVGVDALDELELVQADGERDYLSLRVERLRRKARPSRRPLAGSVARQLRDEVNRTLAAAIHQNPDRKGWQTLYVVAVGGGSRLPELRDVVIGAQARGWVEDRQQPGLALEKPRVIGASTRPPTPDEEYELVSVLGSAVPVWDAGEFGTADQIARTVPIYEGPPTRPRLTPMPWV